MLPHIRWEILSRIFFFSFVEMKKWKSLSCVQLFVTQARILEWGAFPFSRGSSQPRSLALQADSLAAEPQGKPKNTGVGSLSLLQWMFPIQESNWCLLHCGWILYQRSYQGSQREVMVCSIILFSDACRPSLERPIKQKMKWKS